MHQEQSGCILRFYAFNISKMILMYKKQDQNQQVLLMSSSKEAEQSSLDIRRIWFLFNQYYAVSALYEFP